MFEFICCASFAVLLVLYVANCTFLLQKRHISDYQINNRRAAMLSGTGYVIIMRIK